MLLSTVHNYKIRENRTADSLNNWFGVSFQGTSDSAAFSESQKICRSSTSSYPFVILKVTTAQGRFSLMGNFTHFVTSAQQLRIMQPFGVGDRNTSNLIFNAICQPTGTCLTSTLDIQITLKNTFLFTGLNTLMRDKTKYILYYPVGSVFPFVHVSNDCM